MMNINLTFRRISTCMIFILALAACPDKGKEKASQEKQPEAPAASAAQPKPSAGSGGACNENDIKVAINPKNHKFSSVMDDCATSAMGNAESTAKCLKEHYKGLSEGCASCFGQTAACSKSNCAFKCLTNHQSEGCLSCSHEYCTDPKGKSDFSLVKCTGLKVKQLPPKK